MTDSMDRQTFSALPATEIAQIVAERGPLVCGFPINGTRRWVLLEKVTAETADFMSLYMHEASKRHVELYGMLFEHGVTHLLTPIFGPDILERGDAYMAMAAQGMEWLVEHPYFVDFYAQHQVRVRFYGDYRRYLADTPLDYLIEKFDALASQTAQYDQHHLFYGVFAHDATQAVAELSVAHYQAQQQVPDKDTIIAQYYGVRVPPLDLFIGYEFSVFDVPLIGEGDEHLYFTAAPSPYLTEGQLRDILYDHLFAREGDEADYGSFNAKERAEMQALYHLNEGRTFGVGARHAAGYWYPLPQMRLPAELERPTAQAEEGDRPM